MNNPLLSLQDLPDYSAIRAEHVTPAVTDALQAAEAALEQALAADGPSTYASLSACLDQPQERLGRVWGAVSHLHHVADTPELRAAYTENLPKISEFYTRARQLAPDAELEMPEPAPSWTAITRRDFVVRRLPLEAGEFELLSALVAGAAFGPAVEAAAERWDLEEARIGAWFARWANEGLFVGVVAD